MKNRVVMADIAMRAGVHTTTVSLALRNHPSLPVATRERIRALAEEMGYRPDPALASLMAYRRQVRGRTELAPLAYVTNWSTAAGWKESPAHDQFFKGAASRAAQLGYTLEHFWLGEPNLTDRRLGEILYSRGITGVILASHLSDRDAPLHFEWERFSAVKIDFNPHEPALHLVTNDQRSIMQLTVRKVAGLGYRRIGLVMPQWWDRCVDLAWSAGFLAAQRRLPTADHLSILEYADPVVWPEGSFAGEPVPAGILKAWIERHRPEVVVSFGPFVLPALRELDLTVPRDLAFAEIFLEEPDGGTAGVRHNCLRVGELAVEILAGQLQQNIAGIPEFPTVTLVEGTWFDGASLPRCGAVAGAAVRR